MLRRGIAQRLWTRQYLSALILPITAYGMPVLRRVAEPIEPGQEGLEELIANMWETMYNANGVGLAAPQIGQSMRLFLVDSLQLQEDAEDEAADEDAAAKGSEADAADYGEEDAFTDGIKKAFLNAEILEKDGDPWAYEEGCLSIPDVRADVERPDRIVIRYQDEHFMEHTETFDGLNARIIQHEYDHIEGKLFTDYVGPLKLRMLKKKLDNIRRGRIQVGYKMKFAQR
jgi:peptide deformylase